MFQSLVGVSFHSNLHIHRLQNIFFVINLVIIDGIMQNYLSDIWLIYLKFYRILESGNKVGEQPCDIA